jgi:hypothetical protein
MHRYDSEQRVRTVLRFTLQLYIQLVTEAYSLYQAFALTTEAK